MPRDNTEFVNPHELTIIGLDTDENEDHPLYDERIYIEVDEDLIKNIGFYGIQHPVLVQSEDDRLLVVDGRQRVRAARRLWDQAQASGSVGVKVPVRRVDAPENILSGIMISTNELRRDDDILAKAIKAHRMYRQVGNISEVAIAFGRSEQAIRNYLSVAEADSRLHEAIRAGKIAFTTSVEIARLTKSEQRIRLEALMTKADASDVKVTGAVVRELEGTDKNKATIQSDAGGDKKRKSQKKSEQNGVKRLWLRRALKTQVATKLTDEQRALLHWIATGESTKGMWFDDFMFDAEIELTDRAGKKGRPKKSESAGSNVKPVIRLQAPSSIEEDEDDVDEDEDDLFDPNDEDMSWEEAGEELSKLVDE
jgi:ParB-like chromosome segregation protein Spo0J